MTRRADTKTQVRALLWEEARVGGLIVSVSFGVAALLLLQAYNQFGNQAWIRDEMMVHFAAIGVPLLTAFMLILNPDYAGHLTGGYSKRILRYPVQTSVAVAVSLFARTAMVLLMSALLLALSSALFEGTPGVAIVCLVSIVFVCAQLTDWLRGPLGGLSSLIVLGLIGVFVYVLWPGSPDLAPIDWTIALAQRSPWALPIALPVALGIAYGFAAWLVHADRIGRRYGIPELWEWPRSMPSLGSTRTTPFRSALAAQVWFELRRTKGMLPIVTVGAFLFMAAAVWVTVKNNRHDYDDGDALRRVATWGVFAAVFAGAMVHGVLARVVGFRRNTRASGYEYMQPLTDAQFAAARVIAGAIMLVPVLLAALAIHFGVAGRLYITGVIPEALDLGIVSYREAAWMLIARGVFVGLIAWSLIGLGTRLGQYALIMPLGFAIFEGITRRIGLDPQFVWVSIAVCITAFTLLALAHAKQINAVSWSNFVGWVLGWALLGWLFRYALLTTWAPNPVPVHKHAIALVNAFACAAPLPLVYLAFLFDVRRRRRATSNPLDSDQHAHAPKPGSLAPASRVAFGLLAAGVVWLGWPAAPAFLTYRTGEGYPATLDDLRASYPEPPADENVARRYMAIGQDARKLRVAFEQYLRPDFANPMQVTDYLKTRVYVIGSVELPQQQPIPKEIWESTTAYWESVTSKVASNLKSVAAADVSTAHYPFDLAQPYYFNRPEIRSALGAAPHLELDSLYWTVTGKPGDAVESIHAIVALSQSLANAPLHQAQTDRLRLLDIACDTAETLLNRSVLRNEDLQRLQAVFEDALPDPTEAMVLERGIVGDTTSALTQLDSGFGIRPRDVTLENFALELAYPMAAQRMQLCIRERQFLTNLRRPWRETARAIEETEDPYWHIRLAFMFPRLGGYFGVFERSAQQEWTVRTRLDLVAVAAAVERFRIANGSLPSTLSDLVPAFLSAIPKDHFAGDGQPLRYIAREDGEFVVYSMGPDMDDDLGDGVQEHYRDFDLTITLAPLYVRGGPQIAEN